MRRRAWSISQRVNVPAMLASDRQRGSLGGNRTRQAAGDRVLRCRHRPNWPDGPHVKIRVPVTAAYSAPVAGGNPPRTPGGGRKRSRPGAVSRRHRRTPSGEGRCEVGLLGLSAPRCPPEIPRVAAVAQPRVPPACRCKHPQWPRRRRAAGAATAASRRRARPARRRRQRSNG